MTEKQLEEANRLSELIKKLDNVRKTFSDPMKNWDYEVARNVARDAGFGLYKYCQINNDFKERLFAIQKEDIDDYKNKLEAI